MILNGNGSKKIIQLLDKLAELNDALARVQAEHAAQVNTVLEAAGVLIPLAEIEAEHLPRIENVKQLIEATTSEIKTLAIKHGETVPGSTLQAVYVPGRVSWDDKALQGYIAAGHTEVEKFRKVGEPSAQVRPVKAK